MEADISNRIFRKAVPRRWHLTQRLDKRGESSLPGVSHWPAAETTDGPGGWGRVNRRGGRHSRWVQRHSLSRRARSGMRLQASGAGWQWVPPCLSLPVKLKFKALTRPAIDYLVWLVLHVFYHCHSSHSTQVTLASFSICRHTEHTATALVIPPLCWEPQSALHSGLSSDVTLQGVCHLGEWLKSLSACPALATREL